MTRVAIVFADGCEEVEGLSQVDVLRRLGIQTDMVGLTDTTIIGDHKIKISCNRIIDDTLLDYDLVAFPGGRPGAERLRDNQTLQHLLQTRHATRKWCAAMCAAPIALSRYGLLTDTDFTCYPGFETQILKESPTARFSEQVVVVDQKQKIVTSRGPATAWAFSYALAQVLGYDTKQLEHDMLYTYFKAQC